MQAQSQLSAKTMVDIQDVGQTIATLQYVCDYTQPDSPKNIYFFICCNFITPRANGQIETHVFLIFKR